jgi:hypothetical protein
VSPFNTLEILLEFVKTVIVPDFPLIIYMFLILSLGLLFIINVASDLPNYMVRKAFHVLAFILFLPGIIGSHYSRPRLMVFAFNCVSVALIFLEALRFGGMLPQNFSRWFKEMSDGREKEPNTLIVTHIYLLMGCAFPLCAAFIVTGGS